MIESFTTDQTPLNWRTREKLSILTRMMHPSRSPKWGALFVTKNCNLACEYCQVPTKHPMPDLPTSDWKQIIDRLAQWGLRATTIVGGEPTSRADLPEIIGHLRKSDILPCLISNFVTLTRDSISQFVDAGLFSIQASIDALHGGGRGNRSWLDLLQFAGEIGALPLASTVVTARNVDEIPSLARAMTSRGIVYNCSLYQEVDGVFSVGVPGLKPPRDRLVRAFREIEQIKRETGLVRTTYRYLRGATANYYDKLWHCDPTKDSWINVNADGTLMPCQEYESSIHVLEIPTLKDRQWRDVKKDKCGNCAGCYYQCYFEQENSGLRTGLQELQPISEGWKLLSPAVRTS